MHSFSIRDIENLSGIKAHTLRIWEQRYGLSISKRKESQHRYFDNEDLKHILRIAYLYNHGFKISRIAGYTPAEIVEFAAGLPSPDHHEVLLRKLLEASLDCDQGLFEKLYSRATVAMNLESCMEHVIYPFLHKIGLLWMTNHVLPAQEHFCTHLFTKIILSATDALPIAEPGSQRVALFTPEGEDHEISLLFIQYLLKKKGLKTVMLGRQVPISVIAAYCAVQPVSHLYFHLVTHCSKLTARQYLDQLTARLPGKKILASGPGLKEIQSFENIVVFSSPGELMKYSF